MFPTLLKIGPIALHTYGLMLVIGFFIAVAIMKRLAKESGEDPEVIANLAIQCLLIGVVTCRILFVFTQWSYFSQNPLDIFKIWQGGLVFYGGPIGVLPYFIYYARKHRLNLWRTADILIIGVTFNHAFGRLGCFAAGCCYGSPTDHWWGVKFHSELVDTAMRGVPLHPTQLYECFSLLILGYLFLRLFRNRSFDGQVFLTYGLTYPILRSIVEIFRGDIVRGFLIPNVISTSQAISLLVFIAALVTMILRSRGRLAVPTAVKKKKR